MKENIYLFRKYLLNFKGLLILALGLFITYLCFKYFFKYIAPFITAFIISLLIEPVINFFECRIRMPRKVSVLLAISITFGIMGLFVFISTARLYGELLNLKDHLPFYIKSINDTLDRYFEMVNSFSKNLPEDLSLSLYTELAKFPLKLQELVSPAMDMIILFFQSIPSISVFLSVTILATYFMCSDRVLIRRFIYRQLPPSFGNSFRGVKTDALAAIMGYLKAMIILMCFTFIEMCTGLFIIRVDYALSVALLVALADAIPVFGTSTIMVPWIFWCFINGNNELAVKLLILHLIGIIARQTLEPKIVGSQIGLHPLITLAAMYIGMNLLGIAGMFIAPVLVIIIKSLNSSGLIRLWK